MADHLQQSVRAFDGRTSYHNINNGGQAVGPSRVIGNRFSVKEAWKEAWNRHQTGNWMTPELRTYEPERPAEVVSPSWQNC